MTSVVVGVVDVYVIRVTGKAWRVLALQRAEGTRSPGSWETVHGRIEPGETPVAAARRELFEETGLEPERLYSVTVNPFYLHQTGAVQLAVVFAAFVETSEVVTGDEHQAFEWLTVAAAGKRFTWPRETEALGHIRKLLASGTAGAVEDVLRMT
jgi:8-oxo-dGTP pyrophosphatase MutT (NUDIX family)